MLSIQQVHLAAARAYLNLIRPSAKLFLSVNQESKKAHKNTMTQHRVADLIAETGGFERLHRHPYWMQQGYVEELYRVE